ncbi:MAG: hypothetical protein ABEK17_05020 [Candidatus Aenigmatarchaeota archaeon]
MRDYLFGIYGNEFGTKYLESILEDKYEGIEKNTRESVGDFGRVVRFSNRCVEKQLSTDFFYIPEGLGIEAEAVSGCEKHPVDFFVRLLGNYEKVENEKRELRNYDSNTTEMTRRSSFILSPDIGAVRNIRRCGINNDDMKAIKKDAEEIEKKFDLDPMEETNEMLTFNF